MPKPPRRARRAFTLIELMIVVAIMALVAAVLVPMAISRAQREAGAPQPASQIEQPPPQLAAWQGDRVATPPRMRSTDVHVKLSYAPVLVGQSVRSRYVAELTGTFEVESPDPAADHLALVFPFPPGMAEARRVSLELLGADGTFAEPPGVRYGLDGIRWDGPVAPGRALTARVAYAVVGQDTFGYGLSAEGRTGKVRVAIDVDGPGTPIVPASALEPTVVEPHHLAWEANALVSRRPIVVELPPGSSTLGRLVLLLRYAALALFAFGAGFWYLSEGDQPGRLDRFRFAHFLLLAVNYSLFFAVAGVLLQALPALPALLLAAAVGLLLLGVHVARISSVTFSVTKVLPLAAFTLFVAAAAVFLEAQRPLVLLAAGVAATGYVTLTYRAWDLGRRQRQAERAAEEEARQRAVRTEGALAKAKGELEAAVEGSDRANVRAAAMLDGDTREVEDAYARAERASAGVASVRRDSISLLGRSLLGEEERRAGAAEASRDRQVLEAKTVELEAALTALGELRGQRDARARTKVQRRHCVACGAPTMDGDARFCGRCGAARPEELECRACGERVRVPVQVLRRRWGEAKLCCEACGEGLPVPSAAA